MSKIDYVAKKQWLDHCQHFASTVKAMRDARVPVDVRALAEWAGIPIDKSIKPPPPGEVFQYHLTFGILTLNEARAFLGYPPVKGPEGDKPPVPVQAPGAGDPGGDGLSAKLDRLARERAANGAK